MKVFLLSLLKTNPNFDLDILILTDDSLCDASINSLRTIYNKIKIIEAKKDDYIACLPTTQQWGFNLYYRFDVFDMRYLNYDRIIILDSDMVVLSNLSELFSYKDDFVSCQKYQGIPEIHPGNLVEQNRKRFNCGLMSFSKALLLPQIKQDLIKITEQQSWSSDQPVFNLYFADKVTYIPQKFNVVSSIATRKNLEEAIILQYHGFVKPWNSNNYKECFGEEVKKGISKNCLALESTMQRLKKIFDDYAVIANTI